MYLRLVKCRGKAGFSVTFTTLRLVDERIPVISYLTNVTEYLKVSNTFLSKQKTTQNLTKAIQLFTNIFVNK